MSIFLERRGLASLYSLSTVYCTETPPNSQQIILILTFILKVTCQCFLNEKKGCQPIIDPHCGIGNLIDKYNLRSRLSSQWSHPPTLVDYFELVILKVAHAPKKCGYTMFSSMC